MFAHGYNSVKSSVLWSLPDRVHSSIFLIRKETNWIFFLEPLEWDRISKEQYQMESPSSQVLSVSRPAVVFVREGSV